MEIEVLFFGVLAEITGTYFKHYRNVRSISDLKIRIIDDFPEIAHFNFRISYNSKITEEDVLLKSGDEIAFIPPFSGG